jgi:rod shape-determining protein MreC
LVSSDKKFIFFAFGTLTVCFLALYIHQHRHGRTGRVDGALTSLTGNLQENSSYLGNGVRTLFGHYIFLMGAAKRNEQLEKEVAELKQKVVQLQEAEAENRRMSSALDFKAALSVKTLAAKVVAQDISNDFVGIRIDRGSRDGVEVGMGVIHPGGVVGTVYRVADHFSEVLTLADPASNIDSVIQRSRARGIISGESKTLHCKLKYMDRLEDVTQDDAVVTTNFGGIFPSGLLIGHVSEVTSTPNGILQNITVKTAVDLYRLEEVLVVISPVKSTKATS